jgi:sulfopyruvate decarboxylase TPP-binding subunit
MDTQSLDINQLASIANTLSLTVFLLYVWNAERKERIEAQSRLLNHLEKEENEKKDVNQD